MELTKHDASLIVAQWIGQIERMPRGGLVDYRHVIPADSFTLNCRAARLEQQAVTGLFVRERGETPVIAWGELLEAAEMIVERTFDRKEVRGLIAHKGWRFNQRFLPNGDVEIRPGIGFVIGHSGRMPTADIIARITKQGPNNPADRVEAYGVGYKGIREVELV